MNILYSHVHNIFKDNFSEILFCNKIEGNLQRFPIYPLTPQMHSIPYYQHPNQNGTSFFLIKKLHETTMKLH